MKASRWSTNVTRATPVRWTVQQSGSVVAITLTQLKKDGSSERLCVMLTKEELEQILEHAAEGKWVEDKKVGVRK